MKAPEKIYLHRTTGNNRLNGKVHPYKPAKIRDDDKIIEYIRKDALLEWAKECTDSFNEQMKDLKQTDIAYRVICGGLSTIELLLNKLNSL